MVAAQAARHSPKAGLAVFGMASLAVFLWGATPIATKFAVGALDPLLVGSLRTLLAVPIALLVLVVMRLKLPRSRAGRLNLLLSALCGFVVFPLLFSLGQQRTSAAHGALLLALLPVGTGFVAAALARQLPRRRWWLGSGLALFGTLLLVNARFGISQPGANLSGDLLILASCLAASIGYVTGAKSAAEAGTWSVTFWGLVIGGLFLLPGLPLMIDASQVALSDATFGTTVTWSAVAYLALGSSVLAYAAWYWALAQGDITRTAQIQFAQPVVGVVLAAVLLGELLTGQLLLAAAVILAGVALAQSAAPRRHDGRIQAAQNTERRTK